MPGMPARQAVVRSAVCASSRRGRSTVRCDSTAALQAGRVQATGRRGQGRHERHINSAKKGDKMDKKVYEAPAVVYSQVLEAVAGNCEASNPVNGKATSSCSVLNS